MPSVRDSKFTSLSWTISVPLLNSPVVLRQTAGVLAITFVLVSLLVSTIFAVDGDWSGIPVVICVIGLIHLGFVVVALLVMALFYRNRMNMRFHLDKRGVNSEVIDRRAANASKWAIILGLFTGNFSAAGAGMLARSGSRSFVSWRNVNRLRFDERRHTIYLMGRWHTKAALFCSPEIYPQAKKMVEELCSPR